MEENGIYHVFNKSISGYKIFDSRRFSFRMIELLDYYRVKTPPVNYSQFINTNGARFKEYLEMIESMKRNGEVLVKIIAFCIMPTHFHVLLEEVEEDGISIYTNNILNSYTRHFNSSFERKGPLWQNRTKRVEIKSDEQLIYVTKYIHLNPVKAGLVKRPDEWPFSSYSEYVNGNSEEGITAYREYLNMSPDEYKKFCVAEDNFKNMEFDLEEIMLE